jgi:hypothetical protein
LPTLILIRFCAGCVFFRIVFVWTLYGQTEVSFANLRSSHIFIIWTFHLCNKCWLLISSSSVPTNHPSTGAVSFTTFGIRFGLQDYSSTVRETGCIWDCVHSLKRSCFFRLPGS